MVDFSTTLRGPSLGNYVTEYGPHVEVPPASYHWELESQRVRVKEHPTFVMSFQTDFYDEALMRGCLPWIQSRNGTE